MATNHQKQLASNGQNPILDQQMQQYPFIFSNEGNWKLKRHFFFWLWWWLFQTFLYSFVAFNLNISYGKRVPIAAIESFFFLLPHMFLSYSLIYWAIPRLLLKGRYVATALSVGFLFLAAAFISALIGIYILPGIRGSLFGLRALYNDPPSYVYIFPSLLAGLRGAITIGGLAAAIKLMKYWYVKEQRNLQLQNQNFEAQLQLLKAQVHPHFLFNTLNNIYAFTQNTSPVASKLVMGLSDLLRYMLYECNQPLVPLAKELKMLRDYISLEQVRYSDQLEINVQVTGPTEHLHIAPLLLLPFVENSFKHGASQMIDQPWISLYISVKDTQMEMKIVNGKTNDMIANSPRGIGITNIRKRLELLYAGKHILRINEEADVFVVTLTLELDRIVQPMANTKLKSSVA